MNDATALPQADAQVKEFILKVYHWMTLGLLLTGLVSWYLVKTKLVISLIENPMIFWGAIILELGAVFVLAGLIHRMSSGMASLIFLAYAALNGVTLSLVFMAYTQESVENAFFVSAGTFAAMSFIGYTTKKDLTSMGHFLFMGLIGLIIASIVNMFMHSSPLNMLITYAGVLIFVGLTAYDTQKIKRMANPADMGTDAETKDAISGALMLYLDFINLFLMILRAMGGRRN